MGTSRVGKRAVAAMGILAATGFAMGGSSSDPEPEVGSQSAATSCESDTDDSTILVATHINFAPAPKDGVVEGFNLDNRVSKDDLQTCQITDYTAPSGEEGIDNKFSELWTLVEDLVGDAVDGLLQGVINDGSLLIMLEIEGLDDRQNDDCVTVNVFSGSGKPILGTDNRIASGQTFDLRDKTPFTRAFKGKVENGILTAGPFDTILPISIFQVHADLRIHDGYVRAVLGEDGKVSGILGGGVEVDQVISIAQDAAFGNMDDNIFGALPIVIRGKIDLAYNPEDETCHQISAALKFDGTKAFVFESTQPLKAAFNTQHP